MKLVLMTLALTALYTFPATAQTAESKPQSAAKENKAPEKATTAGLADTTKTGQLPPLTTGLAERAALAFGKKDWATARKCYLEILAEDSGNPLTLANLGAVEQQAGKLVEAKNYFSQAVSINPALQQTWTALGLVSYELGDNYLAISALSRAIHEDPTDARAHNYLAAAAKKVGWLDAAESELLRAIELSPDYANAHFNLALMYLERKPPALELAKRHYDKALSLGAAKDDLIEEKLKQN